MALYHIHRRFIGFERGIIWAMEATIVPVLNTLSCEFFFSFLNSMATYARLWDLSSHRYPT